MRSDFVDSIKDGSKVYIFRFEKETEESHYRITPLNNSNIAPFNMCLKDGSWQVDEVTAQALVNRHLKKLNGILNAEGGQ